MTEQRNQTWAQSQASTLNRGSGFLVEAVVPVRVVGRGSPLAQGCEGFRHLWGSGKKSRAD